MGIFGKSKKEREKEYMNKLDVKSCLKENFELIIDDVFTIIGVGTVATGYILTGMCRVGEDVSIYVANGDVLKTTITTVDAHTKEQTLPLLLISPGLSGQQAIRRQTISASDSCCPIN